MNEKHAQQNAYEEIIVEEKCCSCHAPIGEDNNLDVTYYFCKNHQVYCPHCFHQIRDLNSTFYSRRNVHDQIVNFNHANHNPNQNQLSNFKEILCSIPSKELPIQVSFLSTFFDNSDFIGYLTRKKETDFDHCIEFRDLYIQICTFFEVRFDANHPINFLNYFLRAIRVCENLFVKKYQLDECFVNWILDESYYHKFCASEIHNLIIQNEPQYDGISYEQICYQFKDFIHTFKQWEKSREINFDDISKPLFYSFNILPTVLSQYEDEDLHRLIVDCCNELYYNTESFNQKIFYYDPINGHIDDLFRMYYKIKDKFF